MTRRIVYIATTTNPYNGDVITTALCSDGGVWQHIEGESNWKKLPDIPQAWDDQLPDIDADTDMSEVVL